MQAVLALVGVLIGSLVSTGTAMLLYRRQQRDIRMRNAVHATQPRHPASKMLIASLIGLELDFPGGDRPIWPADRR